MWIRFEFFERRARDKGADFLPAAARQEFLQPTYSVSRRALLGVLVAVALIVGLVLLKLAT